MRRPNAPLQQRTGRVSAPISSSNNRKLKNAQSSQIKILIAILISTALLVGYGAYQVVYSGATTPPASNSRGTNGVRGVSGAIDSLPMKKVVEKDSIPSAIRKEKSAATSTKKYSHNFPEPPPTDQDGTRYHVIFSTSCSGLTHWQSFLFFYQAMKVQQIGNVTRIASSCSDEEKQREKEWHETHIQSQMSDRFKIHFTPHFMSVKNEDGTDSNKDYKFFNKPFGLKHWMEHGEGMGLDPVTGKMVDEDVVVILLDPDMAFLRPITADFSEEENFIISGPVKNHESKRVEHGYPYAQLYAFGAQPFRRIDIATFAGKDSPALLATAEEQKRNYPVGPPYIATSRDMYAIATKWTEFVPSVHKQYPELLAEMFAFSIAAAHVKLPHTIVDSLMISNPGGREGDAFIHNIPDGEVCETAYHLNEYDGPLPNVIHFCQRYIIGDWLFAKHRPHLKEFFSCDSPLLKDPPMDLEKTLYAGVPEKIGEKKTLTAKNAKMNAFMVCGIHAAMNEAGEFFKKNHCEGKGEKTLQLYHTIAAK
mmetsp:Transcript_24800/g.36949  ORF Transcript_24800/g.36949 Transcript_24800/m.36949 type:complete len:535 (-) Transcript_24800:985-2589(-)